MNSEDLWRIIGTAVLILLEAWAMQPYKVPLIAQLWLWISRWARATAMHAGILALTAENNYYTAVEAGI